MKFSFMLAGAALSAQALLASNAAAQFPQQQQQFPQQQQQFPQQQFPQQQFPQQQFPQQQFPQQQQLPRERTSLEIGALYGVSAAYGVGMGVWVSSEAGIEDPGLFLIPPAILGVGGPVGVFLFDRLAKPKRGVPAAIATGALIGAGEGLGVWSYQHVTSKKEDEWSFKALARSEALGALTHLVLRGNLIGNEGALALARSEALGSLVELDIQLNYVDLAVAAEVAASMARRGCRVLA